MLAFGLIVAAIIFGNFFTLGLWFSFAMVALLSGYILYYTSNVIHHYPTDKHVAAALALFSSIATLSTSDLMEEAAATSRRLASLAGRIVLLAAELDRREAWRDEGATSLEAWLAERGAFIDDIRSALAWAFSGDGDEELGVELAYPTQTIHLVPPAEMAGPSHPLLPGADSIGGTTCLNRNRSRPHGRPNCSAC